MKTGMLFRAKYAQLMLCSSWRNLATSVEAYSWFLSGLAQNRGFNKCLCSRWAFPMLVNHHS